MVIDHHSSTPDENALLIKQDSGYGSCSIMIVDLFLSDSDLKENPSNQDILLGTLADTGAFKHISPANTKTLSATQRFIEISGLSINDALIKLNTFSQKEFLFLRPLIENTRFHHLQGIPPFITSFYDLETIRKSPGTAAATYKLYQAYFISSIKEYVWGFLVYSKKPDGLHFSVSMRSRDASIVNVKKIAMSFGGGGHDGAAAFEVVFKKTKTSQEVIDWLVAQI